MESSFLWSAKGAFYKIAKRFYYSSAPSVTAILSSNLLNLGGNSISVLLTGRESLEAQSENEESLERHRRVI